MKPTSPLSLPATIMTLSPFRSFILMCCFSRFISALVGILKHLRSERNDFHEVSVAKLASHRSKDAGAPRLEVCRVDHDTGVFVETNRRTIHSPRAALRPHDHGL